LWRGTAWQELLLIDRNGFRSQANVFAQVEINGEYHIPMLFPKDSSLPPESQEVIAITCRRSGHLVNGISAIEWRVSAGEARAAASRAMASQFAGLGVQVRLA
jgi:hypothetical protein